MVMLEKNWQNSDNLMCIQAALLGIFIFKDKLWLWMVGANTTDKDRNWNFWEVHFVKFLYISWSKKSVRDKYVQNHLHWWLPGAKIEISKETSCWRNGGGSSYYKVDGYAGGIMEGQKTLQRNV